MSTGRFRAWAVVGLVSALLALAGCGAPDASPTPSATSVPSASMSPSPSASAPPSASESPAAPDGEMTAEQAITSCIRSHEAAFSPELRLTLTGEPRAYERTVEPHWLVLIPGENENGPAYVECRLGGPFSETETYGAAEIIAYLVTDEYIQDAISVNDSI